MKLVADGKTKTLFDLGNDRVLMVFKDDVTGSEEGVDPGGDMVVGRLEGKGEASLRQAVYFFGLLSHRGIPTHFIEPDSEGRGIVVHRARPFSLEFIVRFKAFGSFVRRYGLHAQEGLPLDALVEITLKDDERGDPLINDEAIAALGLMEPGQLNAAKEMVRRAARILHEHMAGRGLNLVDIKFECGLVAGELAVIDDVSTDNMRVMLGGTPVAARDLMGLLEG